MKTRLESNIFTMSSPAWVYALATCFLTVTASAQTYTVLRSFDSAYPLAGLQRSGNTLFGGTSDGGQYGKGSVFKINTDGKDFQVLHSFSGGTNGEVPSQGITLAEGALLGTTLGGGAGTIFRVGLDGAGYAVLQRFTDVSSWYPNHGLVLASGQLFGIVDNGISIGGGPASGDGGGVLFRTSPDGSSFKLLKNFSTAEPSPTHLLVVSGDAFYGAGAGPNSQLSKLFKLNLDGTGYASLSDLDARVLSLVGYGNKLYGSFYEHEYPWPSRIFQINTDGSDFKVLLRQPFAKLVGAYLGGNVLIGTSFWSGPDPVGTIFQVNKDGTGLFLLKSSPGFVSFSVDVLDSETLYGGASGLNGGLELYSLSLTKPTISRISPATPGQTVEAGETMELSVESSAWPPPHYEWYLNGTNFLGHYTGSTLRLTDIQLEQAGAYTVVATNISGAVTSTPSMLAVVPALPKRGVPHLKLTGNVGDSLSVESTLTLGPESAWSPLFSVLLTNAAQFHSLAGEGQSPHEFYRAKQTDPLGASPGLEAVTVPAITLVGAVGASVRLEFVNRYGPVGSWVSLGEFRLVSPTQVYLDVSAVNQPARTYRIVHLP
jgi:uncharacterized repeat protein (TIGR03803 family)